MKNLPERSTRGVRQRNLQGAAMEADIQFWNQDYFKEISDDDDFSDSHGSEPLSDSEDSDIDLPEDEPEQPIVIERPEKKEKVKRTVYLDPAFKKRKPKKKPEPPKQADGTSAPPPPVHKPKAPAPPLEVKLRASTQYKSMVSATQRQFEEEMEEASSRPRKKQQVRRLTQNQMLRQCITTEVENTISLHEILKEEEKKKVTTKKKAITGNRVCLLSNATHPYYIAFSSPSFCPEWIVPSKPEKRQCVFNDGVGRYIDPVSGEAYCSLKCGRRLKENREKEFSIVIPYQDEKNATVKVTPSVKSELNPPIQSTQTTLPPSLPSKSPNLPVKPKQPPLPKITPKIQPQQPQSQPQSQQSQSQQPQQPQSQLHQPQQSQQPQQQPQSQPQTMIVSTTNSQGQIVRYQLNLTKPIYINSQAVTVPVNQNQVYYLQTASTTGEKSVQPHLMTGTSRMNDGNVYYCMVPMIPLISPPIQ